MTTPVLRWNDVDRTSPAHLFIRAFYPVGFRFPMHRHDFYEVTLRGERYIPWPGRQEFGPEKSPTFSEESLQDLHRLLTDMERSLSVCRQEAARHRAPERGPERAIEAAAKHQQDIMLFTGHHWEDARHSLPFFCDGRCDGLLLIGPHTATDIVGALLDRQMPFTLINNRWDDPRASWVDVDDTAAAAEMTSYLLETGHRRVALLCGDLFVQCVPRRIEGYRQAFAAHGLVADPALILHGSFMPPSTADRVAALLALPAAARPTALFCMTDVMALEALETLSENGVRVPEEISVVGFDDTAPGADPKLTTMRQPLNLLGMQAVELLLEKLKAPNYEAKGGTDIQPTELRIRHSSRPL